MKSTSKPHTKKVNSKCLSQQLHIHPSEGTFRLLETIIENSHSKSQNSTVLQLCLYVSIVPDSYIP